MDDTALQELGDYVASALPNEITGFQVRHGELTLHGRAARIVDIAKFLRDDTNCQFRVLVDICGVDFPERPERFDVVYHFLSPVQNQRLRVKVTTDAVTPVPSLTSVFPNANWYERETWDLLGVLFSDHPDLRRILTDYGFQGHPLRKDFPLTGFVELRYDEDQKRVVYEPVKLTQEFRRFDFMSPWEGAQYILPGDEKAEKPGEGS